MDKKAYQNTLCFSRRPTYHLPPPPHTRALQRITQTPKNLHLQQPLGARISLPAKHEPPSNFCATRHETSESAATERRTTFTSHELKALSTPDSFNSVFVQGAASRQRCIFRMAPHKPPQAPPVKSNDPGPTSTHTHTQDNSYKQSVFLLRHKLKLFPKTPPFFHSSLAAVSWRSSLYATVATPQPGPFSL